MATQLPPILPPLSANQPKKTRWGTLNMGIAKTHRIATQFVGLQLSGANLLALTVSAASIVAGTVTLAAQNYPSNWPLWLAAGVIGLGLALLIEGLTLGSLIRIRLANRLIRQIEEQIEQEMSTALVSLPMPDLSQPNAHRALRQYRQTTRLIRQDFRRRSRRATRLQRQQRRFSFPFAALGAIASATAGGLFYHTILAGLGQMESLVLALLFPLIVTGTFLSSEIHKDAQEEAIKEGFSGGSLTETAIREETKLQSALAVHQKVVAYLEKPEAEQAIEAGAKSVLHDILAELRATSRQMTGRATVNEVPGETTRQMASPTKENDTTATGVKMTNGPVVLPSQRTGSDDTTGPLLVGKQAGDRTASGSHEGGDTTGGGPRSASEATASDATTRSDTTSSGRRQADGAIHASTSALSLVAERPEIFPHMPFHDDQEHARRPISQGQKRSGGDTTPAPVVPQTNLEEKRQHDTAGQSDGIPHDTMKSTIRPPTSLRAQDQTLEATPEHDTLTTQILAYLAQHDNAKQVEIAQALGLSVRTVQRKLAALKHQRRNH